MAATASISPSQQSLSPAAPALGKDSASPRTSAAHFSSPRGAIQPFPRTASATSLASAAEIALPQFTSSLPYTQVRDFAYPSIHPLHYGPQPKDPSTAASSERNSQLYESFTGGSGPAWGQDFRRRSSDPANSSSFASGSDWDSFWERDTANIKGKVFPPPLRFEDGPPWSEDEDLHSPVVRPSRHKGSLGVNSGHSRGPSGSSAMNGEGKRIERRKSEDLSNGHSSMAANTNAGRAQSQLLGAPADAYYQTTKQAPNDFAEDSDFEDPITQNEWYDEENTGDQSRLSQEFWISIGSPEEEMHGKAVALFDFVRENDNELGLVEGQVIWISYRHGMGWLVAQDPKTGDTGLVPEEYVRLLRDIQQHELDQSAEESQSPITSPDSSTTATENTQSTSPVTKNTPIISTFSTSSQDIYPYPLPFHQPGDQPPPEQVRSSTGTPTVTSQEERVRQIQRERERALMEEEQETPRFGSRKGSVFSTGYREDEDMTPVQESVVESIKGEKDDMDKTPTNEGGPAKEVRKAGGEAELFPDVFEKQERPEIVPASSLEVQPTDESQAPQTPATEMELVRSIESQAPPRPVAPAEPKKEEVVPKQPEDSSEVSVKAPVPATVAATTAKFDVGISESPLSLTTSSVPPEDKTHRTR